MHDTVAPGRPITSPYKAAVVPFVVILTTFADLAEDDALVERVNQIAARLPGDVGGWGQLENAAESD